MNIITRYSILALAVLSGFIINIGREFAFAYFYGTNVELEIFRIISAIPFALVGLLSETYLSVVVPFLTNSNNASSNYFNEKFCLYFAIVVIAFHGILYSFLSKYVEAFPSVGSVVISILALTGFIFYNLLSLRVRSRLLVSGKKTLSAMYQPLVNLAIVTYLITSSWIFNHVPSAQSLTLGLFFCSLVVYVLYLRFDSKNLFGKYSDSMKLADHKVIVAGIMILVVYKLVNLVPRFVDRGLLGRLGDGSLAALEYSYTLLSVPVTYLSIIFIYTTLPFLSKANFSKQSVALCLSSFFALSVLAHATQQMLISPNLEGILVRGAFDAHSLLLVSSIYDIHLLATVPLLMSILISIVLTQLNAFKELIACVFVKLSFKFFLVNQIDLNREAVAYTLVYSEYLLLSMLIVVLLKKMGNNRYDETTDIKV